MQQYIQLILASNAARRRGNSTAVVFTSALSGEGVSYVTQSFGVELARQTGKRVLVADAGRLCSLDVTDHLLMPQCCLRTSIPNLWQLPPSGLPAAAHLRREAPQTPWSEGGTAAEVDNVQPLRLSFDYILIDSPALAVSTRAAMLAPFVDGVVLVVEAGATKRHQIRRARQTLAMANGNFLGFVLNKRRYPVPGWLYRRL